MNEYTQKADLTIQALIKLRKGDQAVPPTQLLIPITQQSGIDTVDRQRKTRYLVHDRLSNRHTDATYEVGSWVRIRNHKRRRSQ